MGMKRLIAGSALLLALALPQIDASAVRAQGGANNYRVQWWTVDGGGGFSGGSYSLHGSTGQPDAGTLTGGRFKVAGGFWSSSAEVKKAPDATPEAPEIPEKPERPETPEATQMPLYLPSVQRHE
jgi:hypothetical protein